MVGVCEEAAGDPTVAGALVGLGVVELSMTKVAIPGVKDALRRLTQDTCREAVGVVIAEAADATESRKILEERLGTSLAP